MSGGQDQGQKRQGSQPLRAVTISFPCPWRLWVWLGWQPCLLDPFAAPDWRIVVGSREVTALAGPVIIVDIKTSADPCLTPAGPSGNAMPTPRVVSCTFTPHSPYCCRKLKRHRQRQNRKRKSSFPLRREEDLCWKWRRYYSQEPSGAVIFPPGNQQSSLPGQLY